jgi:SAM-dependent methyltransferase
MPALVDELRRSLLSASSDQARHKRQQLLHRILRPAWFGTLRRTTPLSDQWGRERGTPIDRYYIEQFLKTHRADIHGHVLEIKDTTYTDRFGRNVTHADVLDLDAANPRATLIADLAAADSIPANTFDCLIVTQTLQFIADLRAALAHLDRILQPDGVLLCTVPGISRVERAYAAIDYWRFTPAICQQLFGAEFGPEHVTVQTYGNVLTAMSFLTGLAAEELSPHELDQVDEYFPVTIATRAVKRC